MCCGLQGGLDGRLQGWFQEGLQMDCIEGSRIDYRVDCKADYVWIAHRCIVGYKVDGRVGCRVG